MIIIIIIIIKIVIIHNYFTCHEVRRYRDMDITSGPNKKTQWKAQLNKKSFQSLLENIKTVKGLKFSWWSNVSIELLDNLSEIITMVTGDTNENSDCLDNNAVQGGNTACVQWYFCNKDDPLQSRITTSDDSPCLYTLFKARGTPVGYEPIKIKIMNYFHLAQLSNLERDMRLLQYLHCFAMFHSVSQNNKTPTHRYHWILDMIV